MLGLLLENLNISAEARSMQLEQISGQLSQIIPRRPDRQLARSVEDVPHMNDDWGFRRLAAHLAER